MRTGMVKPLKTLPMINQMVVNRGFASEAMERSVQKLNKSLENEIKHEDEIYSQPEDIDHFLKESGFAFRETGEGVSMTLDKDYDGKHIEIVFEARQPMPDDMLPPMAPQLLPPMLVLPIPPPEPGPRPPLYIERS